MIHFTDREINNLAREHFTSEANVQNAIRLLHKAVKQANEKELQEQRLLECMSNGHTFLLKDGNFSPGFQMSSLETVITGWTNHEDFVCTCCGARLGLKKPA